MKFFRLLLAFSFTASGHGLAVDPAPFTTPEALAAALYAPYQSPPQTLLPELMSPEALAGQPNGYVAGGLASVLVPFFEEQAADPSFSLGYDPLVDGQDFEITEFKIAPAELGETRGGKKMALVIVTFKNFGDPREIWLGMELAENGTDWHLNEVSGRRGAEGRRYQLTQAIDILLADALPTIDDTTLTPFATTIESSSVLAQAKIHDPQLGERIESELEPLGPGRAAKLGGVFGDSFLGRSPVLPYAALFVKKAGQPDAGDIYRLWIEGQTELLDERQKPLVITDPPPTSATLRPVVTSVSLLMIGGEPEDAKKAKLPPISTAETLGHFLLEEGDWERPQNELAEIDFGDERSATLSWSGNGHMATQVELRYSEGDHGAWRFTSKSWTSGPPAVLRVEILDDDGKVQVQEEGEPTAWVLFFANGRLESGRSNQKIASSVSPRLWPQQSFPADKADRLLNLFSNLPDSPAPQRIELVERLLEDWLACMGVSISGDR